MSRRTLPILAVLALTLSALPRLAAQAGGGRPAFPSIDGEVFLQHIKALSSDEFEGRAPGTRGEERTVRYIEDQFGKAGLRPGNTDGTYVQKVPMVGITGDPSMSLTLKHGQQADTLKHLTDFVAWTRHVAPAASIDNSELVFVGYGVVAPEFQWDDYKGIDLRGKTMVVLVNDPPVPDPGDPSKLDAKIFGGHAMTYYGRWTYKYDIGAEKGAAGILLVHQTAKAGYPWSVVEGFSGERFDLRTPDNNMKKAAVEGWLTLDQAKKIFAMAGKDFDQLERQAATRAFRPVPLGVTATLSIRNTLRDIASQNVLGKVEGSDPALKDEYVIYMAHWDHFGIGQPVNGDRIYHGALDNASGVAGLIELGRAFAAATPRSKRSALFVAVTGEEQGLLGSEYYATHPVYPLTKTLAVLNMDGLNVRGRTKDITIVGLGNSDLDDYAREVAATQGRTLHADAEPEKGFYYRSDHFSFAKQGVPALDPNSGIDYIGKPADYGHPDAGGVHGARLPQAVRRGEAGLGHERRRRGPAMALEGRRPGGRCRPISAMEAGHRVQGQTRRRPEGGRRGH